MSKPKQPKPPKLTHKRRHELSAVERADIAVIEVAKPAIESRAGKTFGKIGKLADEPPILALSGAVVLAGLLTRRPAVLRAGLRMLAAEGMAIGFKTFGKDRVDRSRPDALLKDNRYEMEQGKSQDSDLRSFPSGHSSGAFAVAGAAARELAHTRSLYAVAATMGLGQIFRRAHWPSDIATGAVLGIVAERLSGALAAPLLKRI